MPILIILICIIIGIKTPLYIQFGVAAAILGFMAYKCIVAKKLWVDIEAPIYLAFILYFFLLVGIGDLIYYFAYYDHKVSPEFIFNWLFAP